VKVANAALLITKNVAKRLENFGEFVVIMPMLVYGTLTNQAFTLPEFLYAVFGAIGSFLILPFGLLLLYFVYGAWQFAVLAFPAYIVLLSIGAGVCRKIFTDKYISYELDGYLTIGVMANCIVTYIALYLAINVIHISEINSYWFQHTSNAIVPNHPLLFYFINYPFDIVTIMVSIYLLKIVVKNGKYVCFVAMLNILICIILVILQMATFKFAEHTFDISRVYSSFIYSVHWFNSILNYVVNFIYGTKVEAKITDIQLLPIVMSTFIPVVIYMFAIIFLSVSKPIMQIANRLFEVLSEKDESIFKQLATLITAWMAAIKAIYDYISLS
jgi:hypothetical protein